MQWPQRTGELYENFGKYQAQIRNLSSLPAMIHTGESPRRSRTNGRAPLTLFVFTLDGTIGKLFCFPGELLLLRFAGYTPFREPCREISNERPGRKNARTSRAVYPQIIDEICLLGRTGSSRSNVRRRGKS